MPGVRSAEKRAYANNHEFGEHRTMPQTGYTVVLQRSLTVLM